MKPSQRIKEMIRQDPSIPVGYDIDTRDVVNAILDYLDEIYETENKTGDY